VPLRAETYGRSRNLWPELEYEAPGHIKLAYKIIIDIIEQDQARDLIRILSKKS
jgi:hypothetical protein